MRPANLMLLGSFTGVFALIIDLGHDKWTSTVVMAFAGGMLFGKGYGVWEERGRHRALSKEPSDG